MIGGGEWYCGFSWRQAFTSLSNLLCQTWYCRRGWLLILMLLPLKCWHYCRPGPPLIWASRLVPNFNYFSSYVRSLIHFEVCLFLKQSLTTFPRLASQSLNSSNSPSLPRGWNYKAHTIAKRGAVILMCLSRSGISLFCVWLSSCSSTTRDGGSTSQIWHSRYGFISAHLIGFFGLDAQCQFTLFWLP